MPALNKNVIICSDKPLWIPDRLKGLKEDKKVFFRFSRPERKIYRKRKKVPVSQWAEKHRYVVKGPLEGSRFKKTTVSYAAGIMDASFYASVEEVVICAADQVSKSFIVDTCAGYAIDRAPGPMLIVYPDEKTATENVKDRIIPMINLSSRLKSYLTGFRDDETGKHVNLQHMQIYAAWANSPIQLANRSIKYLILDEVDKYPPTPGKREAGTVDKAEKRLRTFRYSRKCWKTSSPTVESGPIWEALNLCQVVFEYYVCCPDCGGMQVMEFESDNRWFRWPEDERDPEKIQNEDLGYYICRHCGVIWTDYKRDAAVKWGEWRAMKKTPDGNRIIDGAGIELFKYLRKYNPKKIGFQIPSWISPFVGISEVCAAFLRGLTDKTKLKDFLNSHKAVPWTDYTQEREWDGILALRDDRPRGIVPGGGRVSCLTAGVDTQKFGFWFEIRAWGWGESMESWQIREGFIDSFEALDEVLFNSRYVDVDDNEYIMRFAVHDAMGGRTSEVYDFARRHRNFMLPFQGKGFLAQVKRLSPLEFYPGTNKKIPGGIMLLQADVNYFKNKLAGKLDILPDAPGAWHYHSETTEDWARQMCAEVIDEDKGGWINPKERPNHGWDCSVYNLVAAEHIGVRNQHKEKTAKANKRKVLHKGRRLETG